MNSSLFRAVDADTLEANVISKAEQRAKLASIPRFGPATLGFHPASLGNFCSTTETLVLRLAADVTRREGRELRGAGVKMADRDRVSTLDLRRFILKKCLVSCFHPKMPGRLSVHSARVDTRTHVPSCLFWYISDC